METILTYELLLRNRSLALLAGQAVVQTLYEAMAAALLDLCAPVYCDSCQRPWPAWSRLSGLSGLSVPACYYAWRPSRPEAAVH